jgi:hypothetical protein
MGRRLRSHALCRASLRCCSFQGTPLALNRFVMQPGGFDGNKSVVCRCVGTPAELSARACSQAGIKWRRSGVSNKLRYSCAWNPTCEQSWCCAGESMAILTDTTIAIRCPYCMVGIECRPMIAHKDGRFVCRDCAHTVRPGIPSYKCLCRPCLRMARGGDAEEWSPLSLENCFSKFS